MFYLLHKSLYSLLLKKKQKQFPTNDITHCVHMMNQSLPYLQSKAFPITPEYLLSIENVNFRSHKHHSMFSTELIISL